MKLEIKDETMAKLPAELATSTLSLAEIGAVFCLSAMEQNGLQSVLNNPDTTAFPVAVASLKDKGILSVILNGNTLSFHLNLTDLPMPPKA